MIGFVARRTLSTLILVFIVTALLFALLPLSQSEDPAEVAAGSGASITATPEQVEEVRHRLGLDRPLPIRYVRWLGDAVQGDLGSSLFVQQPVVDALEAAVPVTLSIAAAAALLTFLLGVGAGIAAAARPGGMIAAAVSILSAVGIATPHFFVGLVLARIFAIETGWLPAIGFPPGGFSAPFEHPETWIRHTILPAVALAIPAAAALARFTAAAVTDVLERDFVRTAIGKGLSRRKVLFKHALKNALIPVVTFFGLELRVLLGGSVAIEVVFALPGIGTLAVQAVLRGDYPVLLGVGLFALLAVTVVNMLVDLSYAYLNPKVRVL